jgi:hypothetical protein
MIRVLIFLIGLGVLAVGVLSYFEVVPALADFHERTVTVGAADFKIDFVLMMLGIPLMRVGLPRTVKWK